MKKITSLLSGASIGLFANSAFAHHPLGGDAPISLWQGMVSGLAHPIIGLDHFAFIVMVGLLALFQKNRLLLPVTFIGASLLGCLLFLSNLVVPFNELLIALSVMMVAGIATFGKHIHARFLLGLIAVAGVLHGLAYGGGIVGAEATPLVAYLISFSIGQLLIALSVAVIAERALAIKMPESLNARLGGAVAFGIGIAFMAEHVESIALGVL